MEDKRYTLRRMSATSLVPASRWTVFMCSFPRVVFRPELAKPWAGRFSKWWVLFSSLRILLKSSPGKPWLGAGLKWSLKADTTYSALSSSHTRKTFQSENQNTFWKNVPSNLNSDSTLLNWWIHVISIKNGIALLIRKKTRESHASDSWKLCNSVEFYLVNTKRVGKLNSSKLCIILHKNQDCCEIQLYLSKFMMEMLSLTIRGEKNSSKLLSTTNP